MVTRTMARDATDAAAKATAKLVSPTLKRLQLQSPLRSLETYCAFLSGKGAGSGWDAQGEITAIAGKIHRPAPVIFDVGANNGAWSTQLATALRQTNPSFYLFECAPHCLDVLKERLDRLPNVRLFPVAVSSSCGEATLYTPNQGSGLSSLHKRGDKCVVEHTYGETVVETVTLDDVVQQEHIEQIDLLKMDIEGHEFEVLQGAGEALSRQIIRALTFEFGSGNVNSRTFFRDFWELLTGHGYRIERIIPGGQTVEVRQYSEDLEYFRGATNYIAYLAV